MNLPIRSILALSVLVVVLAACGTTTGAPVSTPPPVPTAPADPTVAPSQAPAPTVVGTLTQIGASVSGPGEPLADALARDLSQPVFARGVLFLDTDGQVYLADSLVDASVPTFGSLRVRLANYPTDGPTWDIANAELTGIQEANGIPFYADTRIYGTISQ
jgi:hypothetical protein